MFNSFLVRTNCSPFSAGCSAGLQHSPREGPTRAYATASMSLQTSAQRQEWDFRPFIFPSAKNEADWKTYAPALSGSPLLLLCVLCATLLLLVAWFTKNFHLKDDACLPHVCNLVARAQLHCHDSASFAPRANLSLLATPLLDCLPAALLFPSLLRIL